MLVSADSGEDIIKIPHLQDYERIKGRLEASQISSIFLEIETRIGDEDVKVAGWLPGADWEGSPFMPIYEACQQNEELSGKIFGIFVWEAMMKHNLTWSFGRGYSANNVPIESMVYFRVQR